MFHISKRARVGEASGDEGVVNGVNAVPKDISKQQVRVPPKSNCKHTRWTKAGADSSKIGLMALHGWSILKPATAFLLRVPSLRSRWGEICVDRDRLQRLEERCSKMDNHNDSEAHKHALAAWMQWRQDETRTVASVISSANAQTIKENRHYIGAVVNVVSLCCKYAIALRGHRESNDEPSYVNKGNYLAILNICSRARSCGCSQTQ